MVTVTPHLRRSIGVLLVSEDEQRGRFVPLIEAETAVPVRRAGIFETPRTGGDVFVKICEGVGEIKVDKKARSENMAAKKGTAGDGDSNVDDNDSDEDEDEDEDEEVREKTWIVDRVLAEASVRGVQKGAKIEVTVNIGGDLNVLVTAREVGGKGGVRGTLLNHSHHHHPTSSTSGLGMANGSAG